MISADRGENSALHDAATGGAGKRSFVRSMFSDIAPRYDLLNHILSFNIDRRWRRLALHELGWSRRPDGTYLDLCAGTLDVAARLARETGFQGRVVAADFAEPMVRAGVKKVSRTTVAPVVADALELPLANDSMDGAIVAFGARNLADLDAGLREVLRVLSPGGRFVILEFSVPRSRSIAAAYRLYFHRVLPVIGGLISGNRTAYRYLPESVDNFPGTHELADRMSRAGFANVRWQTLTFGVVALHVGEKALPSVVAAPRVLTASAR